MDTDRFLDNISIGGQTSLLVIDGIMFLKKSRNKAAGTCRIRLALTLRRKK